MIHIKFLKEYPQIVPILAEWTYQEWHSYDDSLTVERAQHSFNSRMNDDQLPLTLVAFNGTTPIGMVSLKKGEPEFKRYSGNSPWLGSLHVVSQARQKGIGKLLLTHARKHAGRLGYSEIFLYASNPEVPEWYQKQSAVVVDKKEFRNHTVTLMKIDCSDSKTTS